MDGWLRAVSPRTSSTTSAGLLVFSGKRSPSSRPTIILMTSSKVRPATGCVSIHWPSRRMVISSQMRKISSILCEM